MNIGVAKVLQIGAKVRKKLMAVLVQPRFSIIFISSKEGWCGESHTLPYPGYATECIMLINTRFVTNNIT